MAEVARSTPETTRNLASSFSSDGQHATVPCVFVYGTLKRGECREELWPHRPRQVLQAAVAGALYDLGTYPALLVGEDRVAGELWTFPTVVMAETLMALDAIEGYQQGDCPDLYRRTILRCAVEPGDGSQSGESGLSSDRFAWVYLFAQPAPLQEHQRILPDADGYCRWTGETGGT